MTSAAGPSKEEAPCCGRRVRFAADNRYKIVEVAPQSCSSCTGDEGFQKSQVKVEAELLKPKGYAVLLKNCFDETDKQAQKHINAFAQLPGNEYPRGLEVYLSRHHREDCDQNHKKVTSAVLRRQKTMKAADAPADVLSEKLRSVSKKHSRSSRIFARRLGIADARAVREGDDLIKALTMVKELNQGNAKMVRRKESTEDMSSLSKQGKQGVAIFGLAYMASRTRTHGSSSAPRKLDRIPVPAPMLSVRRRAEGTSLANSCSEVIQDALNLLDFSDEDDSSIEENPAVATVAKTA
ncbi:expressed unknown protein [Seminavis robusta]|uniref:Uncharacterized protein n=1 Tax=Seminavis robusta TaxID=568900 RepID=A0A9N8HMK0_9STRA|nr:expressed unknown protein [Seminavis robusta]|eukprot:Sro905_g218590.1 n/a (295) ;mRNA; r:37900-38784